MDSESACPYLRICSEPDTGIGVYIARLLTPENTKSIKMVLLK